MGADDGAENGAGAQQQQLEAAAVDQQQQQAEQNDEQEEGGEVVDPAAVSSSGSTGITGWQHFFELGHNYPSNLMFYVLHMPTIAITVQCLQLGGSLSLCPS